MSFRPFRAATVAIIATLAAVPAFTAIRGVASVAGAPAPGTSYARPDGGASLDLAREYRVNTIGYRLSRAAVDVCADPQPMTGMVLHDIGSYAQKDRAAIRNAYRLTDGFGVRLVVPGSAADRAGVRAGDEIVAAAGRDVTDFARELIRASASPERTERFAAMLRDAAGKGPVSLRLRRAQRALDVQLDAERGCGGRFVVAPDLARDAWSDGAGVDITGTLVDFTPDDNELAYVLAHEMSHNILHHADRTRGRSPLLANFGIGAGLIKQTEIEADRMAVKVMLLARYDPAGGEAFWSRFSRARGPAFAFTHPGTQRRIAILREAGAVPAGTTTDR